MSDTSRRHFLTLAAAGGLSLAFASSSSAWQEARKAKSVIWLWMDGGMNQRDTWDPKDKGDGSKPIETAVAGIQISELMPVCAAQMKSLSIIRSLSHGYGDHAVATHAMHTSFDSRPMDENPAIGTILARELAKKDSTLPKYLVLGPPLVLPESTAFEPEYQPFRLQSLQNAIPNLHSPVGRERDLQRAALLIEQNREWGSQRLQREVEKVDTAIIQSETLMNTTSLNAFNVWSEPEELRKEYGGAFGEGCLLARRLVQAGCPFVEIGLGGWSSPLASRRKELVSALDRGLGALIKDLAAKGLLKQTLVVCATEFGKSWNDHWSYGFSVVLAGGSLPGGRVYGDTGADGRACRLPVSIKDLFATIYLACGIDPESTYESNGRKIKYVTNPKPLEELF